MSAAAIPNNKLDDGFGAGHTVHGPGADTLPVCHGNNGPLGINCRAPVCNGTNGPKDGPTGTPCTQQEPDSIPHYNTDPTAGRPYGTTGDRTRTEDGIGHYPNPPNHPDYNDGDLASPAPFHDGSSFIPGTQVASIAPAYIQLTEATPVPEPRPIGVLMAAIAQNY